MAGEVYTLESVRNYMKMVVTMVDIAFPSNSVKVGIYEGGFTSDQPWMITVAMLGDMRQRFKIDNVDVTINPQTVLDFMDHGGNLSASAYAVGTFEHIVERFAINAKDPRAFIVEIRKNIKDRTAQMGMTPEELGKMLNASDEVPN